MYGAAQTYVETMSVLKCVARVQPRLEPLLVDELADLGVAATIKQSGGVVRFQLNQQQLWRVAHFSRLAEDVRVSIGHCHAKTFKDLFQGVEKVAWHAYIPRPTRRGKTRPVQVRVATQGSRYLFHKRALSSRIAEQITKKLSGRPAETRVSDWSTRGTGVYLRSGEPAYDPLHTEHSPVVHCEINGTSVEFLVEAATDLYRRGYRQFITEAPLRETLSAACARLAGLPAKRDTSHHLCVWDPFCGSGTVLIEACCTLARCPAHPAAAQFAFTSFPIHLRNDFEAFMTREVEGAVRQSSMSGQFIGSDRDPKAISASVANAERAGLNAMWLQGDFEEIEPNIPQGACIISNLPYGVRTKVDQSKQSDKVGLFSRFGRMLARRTDLHNVYVLNGHPDFVRSSQLSWTPILRFSNFGLPVQFLKLARQ
eukprot:g52591.t1